MNYIKHVSRLLVLMLLLPLAGCIKSGDFEKFKDIEWNPNLAIPLVSSNLTIMDLIKQVGDSSHFESDNQGFVTLVYKDRLFSVNPGTMFTIPPASFSFSHTFTESEAIVISTAGTLSITIQQDIKLTPADSIRIDSLIYGKGDLTLTISGTVTNDGSIALGIPEARKDGLPLSATFTSISNATKTIDLSGYKFDLTKVPGKLSTFRLNATLTIKNSPAGSNIAGKEIVLDFAQHTKSFKVVSGYLGRFSLINDKTTTEINLFANSISVGNFKLVNPYFIFTFHNSIGIPVDLRFTEITGKNNETGHTINIIPNQGIPDPFSVSSPLYADIDPVKVTTVRIDNEGTGEAISDLIDLLKPGKLIYGFSTLTNPSGENSENFLRDASKLDLDVEFGLPLYGLVKNFAVQDTFDFKFENIDEAESMLLRSIIDNEFPLDARMQVYFTGENFVPLDSLVTSVLPADQIIIPAAQVNLSTGDLISATKKISNFSYPRARINKILEAKYILVKAVLNTSGLATQNVKIYNTYKMKVKLAAQVEIKKKL